MKHNLAAVPGQFVALKPLQDASESRSEQLTFYPLASSPYAVHRESADLDASIIEVNALGIVLCLHARLSYHYFDLHKRDCCQCPDNVKQAKPTVSFMNPLSHSDWTLASTPSLVEAHIEACSPQKSSQYSD